MSSVSYLPSPLRCERLESIVARFGGSLDFRTSERNVAYPLPGHASEEIREFWSSLRPVVAERDFLARLPGGRVFGSGAVLSPDGESVARDVSLDFGKTFEEHWLLTYKKIPPPAELADTTAVIATTLGSGYSHWLLDELPRLLVLQSTAYGSIIGNVAHAYSRDAFALRGFSGRVLQPKRYSHFHCAQLVIPSLVGRGGYPTETVARLLAEFTEPLLMPTSPLGERLYITREKARRRRVANEAALWPQLESRGFTKVNLETLSWREQINAFHHAKAIVAPHGAGLANLVFCRPGTRVVELFNRSFLSPCYWRLAAVKALDYRPLIPAAQTPVGQSLQANRLDIEADIAQTLAALR